jgi:GTPase SAR1 family protein
MSFQITKATELPNLLTILIWGQPGAGKTTFACTAPGEKLVINFDPNGPASVSARNDVGVLDLSGEGATIAEEFKSSDPFGLSKQLGPYSTVVIDSLSSIQEVTVRRGIDFARSIKINSNVENPGMAAYQARNNLLLELIRNVMAICTRMQKHLVLVGHEGPKIFDKEGNMIGIPLLLGGKLPQVTGVRLSEIWAMYELQDGRRIAIRPCRGREIAKTRMFDTMGPPEFKLRYDPNKPDEDQPGQTISGWFETWLKNGKQKIPHPK